MRSVKRILVTYVPRGKKLAFGIVCFLMVLLGAAAFIIGNSLNLSPGSVWDVIFQDTTRLKQINGRTNIALLGIGGVTHDGGDLTDTIIVASIQLSTGNTMLISVPRDIWIPSLKDKINAAYHFGEEKNQGGGLVVAKSAIEEVVEIPIHYGVLIDFEGFKQMIDAVGGIDVIIDASFTDPRYPIKGKETDTCGGDLTYNCRFESISFVRGLEHMDGERALKYVRSRHAEGDAGTDFSRAKRQQAVLLALKQELLERKVITNLGLVKQLVKTVDEATVTDFTPADLLVLVRLYTQGNQKIQGISLTQDIPEKQEKGLLVNPPVYQYAGKWVLIPKHGDFSRIAEYIRCQLEERTDCETLIE